VNRLLVEESRQTRPAASVRRDIAAIQLCYGGPAGQPRDLTSDRVAELRGGP
jgi:hypothetical protein